MSGFMRAAIADEYLGLLKRSDRSLTLREFLQARPALGDDDLADLIEVDGRTRLAHGEAVSLDDYLEAAPQLRDFPVSMDAAIDMALRSLSGSSKVAAEAVAALTARHPELAGQIEKAATLNHALLSTNAMRRVFPMRVALSLPTDFGPCTASGPRRYQLRELLGRGASAEVYLGVDRLLSDERTEALVAVKILDTRDDAWSRRQASDEAAKARRVDHPNVVRVIDRGASEDGDEYIVYEHVPGGALDAWFEARGRSIQAREAARLVRDIARGVQAAHIASLIHADLQPGNILMAAGGAPKVADFGVAVEAAEAARMPGAGATRRAGSIAFMSPEQYRLDLGWRSPPTDVYALGGLLHWLLTGRLPNGESESEIDARLRSEGEPQRPLSIRPLRGDADADLEAICQRALAPRREDRHNSAGALADDLEAWLAHEPIGWRKPSLLRITRLWARRRPYAATASVAALIAAITALVLGGWITQGMVSARREAQRQQTVNQSARSGLLAFAESLGRRAERRHAESTLLSLHAVELFAGKGFDLNLVYDPASSEAWITAARRVLDEYAQRGEGRTFVAGLWRAGLAFRLVARNRYDEASAEVERARAIIAPLFAVKDDPTLRLLDDLDRCVVIGRLAEAVRERALTSSERAQLEAAETALWSRLQRADPAAPTSRQESLFAAHIETANGPHLLGNAQRAEAARRFIEDAWRELTGETAEGEQ